MSTTKQQNSEDLEPIANTASVFDIEGYISDALKLYKEEDLFGSDLFEMLKIQFENLGVSTTWKVKTAHYKLLREFLRPISVTREKLKDDIKQSNISHAWTNLVKLYSDDDKYAGGVNESLKLKMRILNGNCELTGISPEDRIKAVPLSLINIPYVKRMSHNPLLMLYMKASKFILNVLNRKNSISLFKIIELQQDKEDVEKAFRTLVTDLENPQPMLHNELQNDIYLQNKILTSCRVHPACTMACSQPTNSSSELISKLYTSIATCKSQQEHISQKQNNNYITERVYRGGRNRFLSSPTNNYYDKNGGNTNSDHYESSSRNTNSNFKTHSNNKASRRKRCFFCENEGCLSVNHSKYEQDDAKRRHRQRFNRSQNTRRQYVTESDFDKEYEQYLLFFKGVNPEEKEQHGSFSLDYDDDYQAFLNETDENINTPNAAVLQKMRRL
ncbi:hypothetical protein Golomagni_01250 [Golovinomyces magnicellulatus]|nr:hypothetical protein Golomagni_01250 [Golovinomyces magnicellulatus]